MFKYELQTKTSSISLILSFASRNCIGQKFAMLEIKATISKIILNFRVKLEKNFKPLDSLELVIKSKNGIMIQIESRK